MEGGPLDPTSDRPEVRTARPGELPLLAAVEEAADGLFATLGMGPFPEASQIDHLTGAVLVLVAGDPPVGFASVGILDGAAHLRQLAVLPAQGGRGLGTALVEAVAGWGRTHGLPAVTLTTFRDVPWNGPFYRSLGFRPLEKPGPELAAVRAQEIAVGEDAMGPRLAMWLEL
jgi:GNAT superfamily N-acetyltransferase